MLFNSWAYLCFLCLGVALFFVTPQRWRLGFLSFASCLFYAMWRWEFVFLIVFSASVDYLCAQRISKTTATHRRRMWLALSLCVNLGLLCFFKYTYFILDNMTAAANVLGLPGAGALAPPFSIVLPLGISFYTFQTISYSIDVYRGVVVPEKNFIPFLAYVTFWPQLIAGPILRAGELIPQLKKPCVFRLSRIADGAGILLRGLFKKVVLADNLATLVEFWFEKEAVTLTALDVWAACFAFGFQIYFDFSGYSDMAVGSARMLGIELNKNFDWPYMACSPRDFWKRWHITLSSWIRDYLYLPLTGGRFRTQSVGGIEPDRAASGRRTTALFATWLLMGLWHGPAWSFALWGLYHAGVLYLFRVVKPLDKLCLRFPVIGWIVTVLVTMASWAFFRAQSVAQAGIMFSKILNPMEYRVSLLVTGMSARLAGYTYLWVPLILAAMVVLHCARKYVVRLSLPQPVVWTARVVVGAVSICLVLLCLGSIGNQFIYFQF